MTSSKVEQFINITTKYLAAEREAEESRVCGRRLLTGEVTAMESGLAGVTAVRVEKLSLKKAPTSVDNSSSTQDTRSSSSSSSSGKGGKSTKAGKDDRKGGNSQVTSYVSSVSGASFSVGDPINMHLANEHESGGSTSSSGSGSSSVIRGVIERIGEKYLVAAMDDFDDSWMDSKVLITRVGNDVTYQRMNAVLGNNKGSGGSAAEAYSLPTYETCPGFRVVELAFGDLKPEYLGGMLLSAAPQMSSEVAGLDLTEKDALDHLNLEQFPFFQSTLNVTQQRAVIGGILSKDCFCILGPPGSGKTTVVIEVILQLAKLGKSLLICTPSNVAADNILEKLDAYCTSCGGGRGKDLRVLRIGHPARVLPSVLNYTLDARVDHSDGAELVKDIKKEITKAYSSLKRLGSRERQKRNATRAEIRQLNRELRVKQEKSILDIVARSNVVVCTLVGASDRYLRNSSFDVAILDEAAMALEVTSWIPILRCSKTILAGDPFQLPPVVLCDDTHVRKALSLTLFERLFQKFQSKLTQMLEIQYRMHAKICAWSSGEFYKGKLRCDESVAGHLLSDLDGVEENEDTQAPLVWINTAGMDFEEREDEGGSKFNQPEARIVVQYVESLLNVGVKPSMIGVITPYNAQVDLLTSLLTAQEIEVNEGSNYIEVSTVDGFQGREKEAIVISAVRSNSVGEVGFLMDERRMNVAITRAKRHVCVIGNSDTLSSSPFLERLYNYFEANGELKDAHEYD